MSETKAPETTITLPMGGQVLAVVPQSFSDIRRMANEVIVGGIAPSSLLKWPKDTDGDDEVRAIGRRNNAAVASVLMAGAELGVPPMAALRMFTSINGKVALYADGNVAVVRRARDPGAKLICEYIRNGYEEVRDYICPVCGSTFETEGRVSTHILAKHEAFWEKAATAGVKLEFERTDPTDRSHAWCEAKRADNGEVHRESFSIADAKKAKLWETEAEVERYGWHANDKGERKQGRHKVPNDQPWYRYPKRMMLWRAAGYCLRWLFADVLNGMVDEHEAREIEMIDITPTATLRSSAFEAPEPPPAPEDESQDQPLHNSDLPEGAESEVADTSDIGRLLDDLDTSLEPSRTEDDVTRVFQESGVEDALAGDDLGLSRAYEIRSKHLDRVERIALAEAGQGDLLK